MIQFLTQINSCCEFHLGKKTIICVLLIASLNCCTFNVRIHAIINNNFSKSLNMRTPISTVKGVEILQYTPHEPIIIDSSDEFSSQGFPGSGTINDPFRIENLNITTEDIEHIVIKDTEVHFTIRNNFLDGQSRAPYGIKLIGVVNGIIENNFILNHRLVGIELAGSHDNIIRNNTIRDNYNGIKLVREWVSYFQYPRDNTIINNTINNNEQRGIWFADTDGNYVSSNVITENKLLGIYGDNSHEMVVSSCIIANNSFHGLFLFNSQHGFISNNTIENNDNEGIYLSGSHEFNIIGNLISKNTKNGLHISDSNFSTILNNIIIDNQEYGIFLDALSGNGTIEENTFIGNNNGVMAQACDEGTGNAFMNNSWDDWLSPDPYPLHRTRIYQEENYITPLIHNNPFKIPLNIAFGLIFLSVFVALIIVNRSRQK